MYYLSMYSIPSAPRISPLTPYAASPPTSSSVSALTYPTLQPVPSSSVVPNTSRSSLILLKVQCEVVGSSWVRGVQSRFRRSAEVMLRSNSWGTAWFRGGRRSQWTKSFFLLERLIFISSSMVIKLSTLTDSCPITQFYSSMVLINFFSKYTIYQVESPQFGIALGLLS